MEQYTGHNWPYEALESAKGALPSTHAHVLLLGEQQDVEGIKEVLLTLRYLLRYGRPFAALYNLTVKRAGHSPVMLDEAPFRHTTFTVPIQRVELLSRMIKERSTLVYEIVYEQDGVTQRLSNFPVVEQCLFLETVEQAMQERGWTPRKSVKKPFLPCWNDFDDYLEAKKAKKKREFPTLDRWFQELSHIWQNKP
jgi:hypothetical protein